jgi:hypothetical protein
VNPPTEKGWNQFATLIVCIGLVFVVFVAILAANNHPPASAISDAVVTLANGQEVPEDEYIAANVVSDPTVTDLRDKDGKNGMWYKVLKTGTITRLWRSEGSNFIQVSFADGRTGKCTDLQKLTVGEEPWAQFTHTQQWDSGWKRQDFIFFEAKVPKEKLREARKIQRGGAGEVTF